MTMRKRGISARGRRSVGRGKKTKRRRGVGEIERVGAGNFEEKKKNASGKGREGGKRV